MKNSTMKRKISKLQFTRCKTRWIFLWNKTQAWKSTLMTIKKKKWTRSSRKKKQARIPKSIGRLSARKFWKRRFKILILFPVWISLFIISTISVNLFRTRIPLNTWISTKKKNSNKKKTLQTLWKNKMSLTRRTWIKWKTSNTTLSRKRIKSKRNKMWTCLYRPNKHVQSRINLINRMSSSNKNPWR